MKRFAISLLAGLLCLSAFAWEPKIRDVEINVTLSEDGSARIVEIWDVCVASGTEWYLVRENLGDIRISDLEVVDEYGRIFINEGSWDIDRSIAEKAGRCGLHRTNNGYEICWGVGSYGDHAYTVSYTMSNVVKSLDDYDCLHMQFVSPGLSTPVQHCKVTISKPNIMFEENNCGIWSFGYNGSINFSEGKIVAESDEPFISQSSLIVLARFEKGLFTPSSIKGGSFESVKDMAFEGSSYESYLKERKRNKNRFVAIFSCLSGIFALGYVKAKNDRKKRYLNMFGVENLKEINYQRGIPFDGNLFESRYVLEKCGKTPQPNAIASAIILRLVKNGQIEITRNTKGKVELSFVKDADLSGLRGPEIELYNMMREASGGDLILQSNEFSRWSRRNNERVVDWTDTLTAEGVNCLREDGFVESGKFSARGQEHSRSVIGFKQYLQDFTLIKERASEEAILWHDYIVFAALYGIADKVAKELKEINPVAFEQAVGVDYPTMHHVVFLSNNMGNAITSSVVRAQSASSVGGHGGFSSFGGGGGFSGGGFGGGSR